MDHDLSDFEVSFEVSHHGPLTGVPTFFIEIGSSENEWNIPEAGKLLADVIMELLESIGSDEGSGNGVSVNEDPGTGDSGDDRTGDGMPGRTMGVGIGGGHYAPRFTDAAMEMGIDFGHMIPGYALKNLDGEMAREMILRSVTGAVVTTPGYRKPDTPHEGIGEGVAEEIVIYSHGKKNRKYYRHFEEFHAEIIEL